MYPPRPHYASARAAASSAYEADGTWALTAQHSRLTSLDDFPVSAESRVPQDTVVRSIGLQPTHVLLLGAGASASSGVPTAAHLIFELKREIFLSKNPQIPPGTVSDVSLPAVQRQLQDWFDAQGNYPAAGSTDEYGFFLERAYPLSADRRKFFESRFAGAVPQIGYQLVAILQNLGFFSWIFTTNFDGLVRQARTPTQTRVLSEIGLDTTFRLEMPVNPQTSYLVYLHGDFRYDDLRNTTAETQELDGKLRARFEELAKERPIVVLGYSGRDNSVLSSLERAFAGTPSGGGIIWCHRRGSTVPERVARLVERARSNGFTGQLVEVESFDDFLVRAARYICREPPALLEVAQLLGVIEPQRIPFDLSDYLLDSARAISNAIVVGLPREVLRFRVSGIADWPTLRSLVAGKPIHAGLFRGDVVAVGDLDQVVSTFAGHTTSPVQRVPLSDDEIGVPNSVVGSIFLESICDVVAVSAGLRSERNLVWDPTSKSMTTAGGRRYLAERAVELSLRHEAGKNFLAFVPDLRVTAEDGEPPDHFAVAEMKRAALARQYNREYSAEIEWWLTRFIGADQSRQFSFPTNSPAAYKFRISRPWASGRYLTRTPVSPRPPSLGPAELFAGPLLPEPVLEFAPLAAGAPTRDIHPIRGIQKYGPYDVELTAKGIHREVRIGVICPESFEDVLWRYLTSINSPHPTVEWNAEYVPPFPGFQAIYRLPLAIPRPGDPEWFSLPRDVLEAPTNPAEGQRAVAEAVQRQIDAISTRSGVDVAVVFVPNSWQNFERIETDDVRLDLHDFVKAYGVQRGVRTQLLREETITDSAQCSILWWLSEALYVKSMRTPFALHGADPGTVFVGVGYGFPKGRQEGGVIFGCSHLYSASGLGLKYLLSRVEEPVWRGRHPFLSKEDAIRIGLQTRQLFYESYQKLPSRVVIHKRTRFTRDEREGFAQALKGVDEVDMLTVEYDDAWRFLAFDSAKAALHPFPVRRGTVMQTGDFELLLWIHGAVRGLSPPSGYSYYQGKARIPTPLRVTRHAGRTPFEKLASELLGLSKMDWNSFDLYTKMPATLRSPQIIARVGQLIPRLGPQAYDYRLFM